MHRKILPVDDSRTVRAIVRRAFRPYACELREAGNGAEALARVAQDSPDLILFDLTMPVMDSAEMLVRLRSDPQLKAIPVLLLAPAGNRDQVRRIGVVDCLMKPFDGNELIGKVRGLIEFRPRPDPAASRAAEAQFMQQVGVIPTSHEIWTLGRASRLDEPLRTTAHPEDSPYLE